MKQASWLLIVFLNLAAVLPVLGQQTPDRKLWLELLDKTAGPVLSNLAEGKLKERMELTLSVRVDNKENRSRAAYLEAFGRTLSGIAPWLNLEAGTKEEVALRQKYREWSLKALANAVDPVSKDYMQWTGGQPLVDASFLALGIIRCPWLWEHSEKKVQGQLVAALKTSRSTMPAYSNWILFSGMIEAFFCKYKIEYDAVRIEYGIREFSQHWYTGDGMFSDGVEFHMDYYNSYVIQPYLAAILETVGKEKTLYNGFAAKLDKISKRYAEIQERMINADGSFPVLGRSIAYRAGAFHHLADMSLRKQLPTSLPPAVVRSALTAVIKRTLQAPGTFTKEGWLNIGLSGNQPNLAEGYINTGSLYLVLEAFLPLGLPETDDFWSSPAQPWTAVKAWNGNDLLPDHALDGLK